LDILCLEFVNSSWYITHKLFVDPLRDSEWLMKLADKWNIKSLPSPTELEMANLIEVRNQFAMLLRKTMVGNMLTKEDIELINNYMANASFYRQLQDEKGAFVLLDIPGVPDWGWFMAEVAASFSRFYSSEAVDSLKTCENTECGWFFVDESKSRNRKWCDDTCATLMKVRRFRQKKKEGQGIVK
jgi:predicted RNA-binding Zn ribbon-like protein